MRLYIKLFAFILLSVGVQRFLLTDEPSSQLWFGLRCEAAYWINDKPWIERLVNEAGDIRDRSDTVLIVNAAG
jgi:hypothetical protein